VYRPASAVTADAGLPDRHPHIGKVASQQLRSRGHVGGEDVVGVAVEVLAGAVVAHGGAWVGVTGGIAINAKSFGLADNRAVVIRASNCR